MLNYCGADLHTKRHCSVYDGSGQGVSVCAELHCSLLDCTIIDMQKLQPGNETLCLCMSPASRPDPAGRLWRAKMATACLRCL